MILLHDWLVHPPCSLHPNQLSDVISLDSLNKLEKMQIEIYLKILRRYKILSPGPERVNYFN